MSAISEPTPFLRRGKSHTSIEPLGAWKINLFFLKSFNFLFSVSVEVSKMRVSAVHSFIYSLMIFFLLNICSYCVSSMPSPHRNCQCHQGACNLVRIQEVFVYYYNTRQDKGKAVREMQGPQGGRAVARQEPTISILTRERGEGRGPSGCPPPNLQKLIQHSRYSGRVWLEIPTLSPPALTYYLCVFKTQKTLASALYFRI